MVEELKLAIKIDDASIEQSLLKQFANAQKMADKVVLDFKNVNFDDKQIEAKFKEMQKKAGQNPIDLTIGGNTLDMLGQIDKRLTEIFSIGKGKSFIDSSSTVADIGKIVQNTNNQAKAIDKVTNSYKNQAYELASVLKMLAKLDQYGDVPYAEAFSKAVKSGAKSYKNGDDIQFAAKKYGMDEESIKYLRGLSVNLSNAFNYTDTLGLDTANITDVEKLTEYFRELLKEKLEFNNTKLNTSDIEELIKALGIAKKELFDDGTKSGRNIYGDGTLDKYSDLPQIIQYLKQQETQAIATAEAEQKLAEAQKETISNTSNSNNSQIEELKSDIQEVKTELGDVKDRISSIESNGFENVRDDVKKTKESVKELNSELTEMKSNISSTPQESNISLTSDSTVEQQIKSESELNAEIEKRENIIRELQQLQEKLTVHEDFHGNDRYFADQLPTEEEIREADKRIKQLTGTNNIFNVDKLIQDRNEWLSEVKYSLEEYDDLIKANDQKALDEYTTRGLSRIGGAESFFGYEDNNFSIASKFVEEKEKIQNEINDLYTDLDKLDEKMNLNSNNSSVDNTVQSQEKLQSELKETQKQAEKTAQAVKESTTTASTEQKKDAFPNADTKLDEAVTSAKDLDKTLEQVDIPTDSFDKVLEKLDRTKSELVDIVKITKQSVSDADGKFHDSYTLKDSRGSTEIYGVNSKTDKGQILRQNIVGYDKKKDELDISKAQLEVDKQLAKEEDNLAKVQQKKAQAFLKEQANYEEDQKKAELIKRQTLAYEELTDTISKYSEVAKRVAGGNADDGDLELMTKLEDKISQLQKQPILSDSQVSKSEKSLVSLYDQLDKIERKLVETNQKSQDKQIIGFDKRLESYTKKTSGYNATIARFNDGGWTSDIYLKNVQAVKDAVKQYEDLLSDIKAKGGIASEDDIQKLKEYESEIKNTIATVTNMSAAEKGYNFVSGQKELDKIHKLLAENSKMSSDAKAKIKAYYAEIESGNPSMSLDKIHGEILKIYNAEVEAGRAGRTLWDTLKNSGFHQIAAQMAGMFGVYDVINIFKQGANTLKEFDDGLTKISYTMDMTKSQLDNLGNSVLDMASNMKSSIDDAMKVAQIYANMQTSAEEIQRLSEPTLILSNLSGFDSSTIADDIQAVTQQFDILAEDSMHIADVYDYISRNIAVDYSKGLNAMAEGLQVAGSTAKQAGLSYEQTASIIAKAVEKTRLEGSQVGNGLKTIMTRLSKVGELSDEVDNETLSQASESLKKVGIEVYNLDGSYREFDVIMGELAGKWDDLTDAEKSNISFNIAATRQTNLLSAVLSNFSDSMQLAEEATNANGSALENQQKYMESFSGHLQSLETEAKIAWFNILDSETLKDGVDLLTGLVKVTGQLVDTFGLLGTAAGIGGIVAGFKNVGIDTLVAY